MKRITVDGVELAYALKGTGRPLLLLHGNGEDHHIFDALVEVLKDSYRIYALDSRNHGKSARAQDTSYDAMAGDLYGFITQLGLVDPLVVGFSDGGIVSLLVAIAHPNLLAKMALLGINLSPKDFRKPVYRAVERMYTATKDPLVELMLTQPNIPLEALKGVETPALVVAAQKDLFYQRSFKAVAKALPNGELVVMEGHDHGSYIIDQDLMAPMLLAFLEDE